jgi:hypothetical protein
MIQPIRSLTVEVTPQAIINRPVADVVGRYADVVKETDDLDTYEGASFVLDTNLQIAVRHYPGYPKDTSTIYIDENITKLEEISALIRKILKEFDLTEASLSWERAKNPEL